MHTEGAPQMRLATVAASIPQLGQDSEPSEKLAVGQALMTSGSQTRQHNLDYHDIHAGLQYSSAPPAGRKCCAT